MIERTGIGTYVSELVQALPECLGDQDRLVVFVGPRERAELDSRIEVRRAPAQIYGPHEQLSLRRVYRQAGLDLLHAPHYNQPVRPSPPMVLTINDLIPLVYRSMQSAAAGAYNRLLLKAAVRRAAHIIAPSMHTAGDLQVRLKVPADRLTVIPDAAGAQWHPRRDQAAEHVWLDQLRISRPFLLYVGQWKPYKNLPQLVRAFALVARSHPDLQLVIGGRQDARYRDVQAVAEPLGQLVRFTDWLPAAAVPHLFRAATLFVLPSLYEGFGLPVLEAMACGTPVVCSRSTSLPEVAGEAAEYWDTPSGTEGLAAAIRQALQPERTEQLRAAGLERARRFSWRDTACRTVAVYRTVLSARR